MRGLEGGQGLRQTMQRLEPKLEFSRECGHEAPLNGRPIRILAQPREPGRRTGKKVALALQQGLLHNGIQRSELLMSRRALGEALAQLVPQSRHAGFKLPLRLPHGTAQNRGFRHSGRDR